MKFVILGGGALGSIIGGHLIRAGDDVTILARGARAAHLRAHGITVGGLVDFSVPCRVETDPSGLGEADVLLVTVKTHQTMEAIRPLKHLRVGSAFSVQNGVLKNRQLAEVFGEEAVLGAIGMLSGELLADGEVRFTMNQTIAVGELPDGSSARCEAIASTLDKAGINASVSNSIQTSEWSKYVGWSGVMALSVLTRLETYKFLSDPDSARVAARIMRETASVADALGISLEDKPPIPAAEISRGTEDEAVAILNGIGATFRERAPQHRVSTLQDVERGQRLEIEETLGHTIAKAARRGVPTPTVETCYRLLSSIDRSLIA
jgi:2-dehydropantoate 2-reductase